MTYRLYLTLEERLRLKKCLDSTGWKSLSSTQASLSFLVIQRKLKELILPLSPLSRARQLIEKLLSLMENLPVDPKGSGEIKSILKELHTVCALKEVSFSASARGLIRPSAEKNVLQ